MFAACTWLSVSACKRTVPDRHLCVTLGAQPSLLSSCRPIFWLDTSRTVQSTSRVASIEVFAEHSHRTDALRSMTSPLASAALRSACALETDRIKLKACIAISFFGPSCRLNIMLQSDDGQTKQGILQAAPQLKSTGRTVAAEIPDATRHQAQWHGSTRQSKRSCRQAHTANSTRRRRETH